MVNSSDIGLINRARSVAKFAKLLRTLYYHHIQLLHCAIPTNFYALCYDPSDDKTQEIIVVTDMIA